VANGRYRLDTPVGEIETALAALTPERLRDSTVEIHSGDGEAWVEVYTPRSNPVPVLSFELPADPVTAGVRCQMVLNLVRDLSRLGNERYAA